MSHFTSPLFHCDLPQMLIANFLRVLQAVGMWQVWHSSLLLRSDSPCTGHIRLHSKGWLC